ncbi:Hsp70 family protein [Cupriavidus metallidurans]|uniref:Hsp70 family protein n=1 Tax=Cupriavidus metallidurans TaxID=119219 RepID=UPI001CC97DDF|nr:Hsp70 family protein [Cupriavidus metallidurans]UBM09987.1 Hsp70 family protein [Cupriavidus metallidurans]
MGIVGFDFGTTNSVMSIISGDRCIPILDEGFPHPSVVSYRGGEVVAGREAKKQLASATTGVVGNTVKSPKTMLGQSSVMIDGTRYSPKVVVRDVVSHVMAHARGDRIARRSGEDFSRAVVTIPVDMNGARRRELREACRMAGLSIYQFVHEPLAALYGYLRGLPDFVTEFNRLNRELVLVFDWGGGTLDLTLCRVTDGMLVQVVNDGCSDVGGDVIDDMLVNEIERRALAARGITGEARRQVGAVARLREEAERAKIALSSKDVYSVLVLDYFHSEAGDVDLEYRISREELQDIVSATVTHAISRVEAMLREARVEPSSIELCLATGGMVNMPLIQERLHEIFGARRVKISERGNTIISEGAAWIAHDRARLMLAKNVEVVVSRSAHFPVIRAGTLMPREGEVQRLPEPLTLYCCDPTDGVAKFQLAAPKRTGRSVQVTDERSLLGLLAVGVDSRQPPLLERLLLDVSIDENLVLSAAASSTIAEKSDSLELHNLEFGLSVGSEPPLEGEQELDDEEPAAPAEREPGAIQVRSNIATRANDLRSVPGEILYKWNRHYFDLRNSPPREQDFEKTIYQPCSACKKVYCECATLRAQATAETSTTRHGNH